MIRLRPEHIQAFDALAERLFFERMIEHIEIHFPKQFANLESQIVETRVKHQIEKAKEYDFLSQQDICDFISLSWRFGDDFDIKYSTRWANEILNDPQIQDAGIKIAKLNDKANQVIN